MANIETSRLYLGNVALAGMIYDLRHSNVQLLINTFSCPYHKVKDLKEFLSYQRNENNTKYRPLNALYCL